MRCSAAVVEARRLIEVVAFDNNFQLEGVSSVRNVMYGWGNGCKYKGVARGGSVQVMISATIPNAKNRGQEMG